MPLAPQRMILPIVALQRRGESLTVISSLSYWQFATTNGPNGQRGIIFIHCGSNCRSGSNAAGDLEGRVRGLIGDRWGVTDLEINRRYPCDEFVAEPALQAWRGVTVQAPAERIWPWVVQIRLAPYSYDWIDNLGRRSPQRLYDVREPVPGDVFTSALGGRQFGRILAVTPGEDLTAKIMGAVLSYVLIPTGSNTRLLLKVVASPGWIAARLLSIGDLIMARRQLLNLARLAEQTAAVRNPQT
jgi:hypothetical protein